MTLWLKQSTAKVVSFGPFLDKTDGVTEETGLVSALDHATTGIKLSKNGGALTIRHASVTATTYDAYGAYLVTLDTTDTNTLGTLRMAFNEAATCLPVWQDFMVLPANVYDSLVLGTDALDVSAIQFAGQTITASGGVTIPAATLASTTNITAGTVATVTTLTNLPAAPTDWLTAAAVKADAVTKIQNGLATPTNITAGTITTTTNLTNLPAAAALEATLTAMKGATFATGTDSLEAIRDRGDAAWATATGFATPTNITAASGVTLAPTTGLGNQTANITGNLSGSVGSVTGAVGSVTGAVGSVTGLTAAHLDVAVSSRLATVGYTAPLDAAGTRTAVGLATANLDTQLADLPTAAENATALLDAANGVETGLTPREALRLTSAALAGKISGAETTTVVIRNTADTKDRITATVDADGNRTAITTDLT